MGISKISKTTLSQLPEAVDTPISRLVHHGFDDSLTRALRESLKQSFPLAAMLKDLPHVRPLLDNELFDVKGSRRIFADTDATQNAAVLFRKSIEDAAKESRSISESLRTAFAGFEQVKLPEMPDFRLYAFEQLTATLLTQQESIAKMFARNDLATNALRSLAEQMARNLTVAKLDLGSTLRVSVDDALPRLVAAGPHNQDGPQSVRKVASDSISIPDSAITQVARFDAASLPVSERQSLNEWFGQLPLWMQIIVVLVAMPLLQELWGVAVEVARDRLLTAKSVAEQQQIVIQIDNEYGGDALTSLRCVRASVLTVRDGPSKSSVAIGAIHRDQAVEVLEQRSGYSLVRYRTDRELHTLTQGWVATSYLSRFVC